MTYLRHRSLTALFALSCAAIGGGVTSPGCAEFDTTPVAVTHGTIGEEIVEVFCERMAADVERARPEGEPRDVTGLRWKPFCEGRAEPPPDAPPRLVALHENRARLVQALDRMFPETMSDELGHFLGELLPFFDRPEERLPTQTRRLADFLDRLVNDDEAIAALERLGTRQGYRPLRLGLGVTRPLLAYPDLDRFSGLSLPTLLDGAASEEFAELQRALALEMATLEPSTPPPAGERTTLELMRELMFTDDALFATSQPRFVLVRDERGLAQTGVDSLGAMVSPFVDNDGDGLADVDDLGRFVDASGALLNVPTPFRSLGEAGVPRDSTGRALRTDGLRYYQYFDASRTMLAGTIAEVGPLFDPAAPSMLQMSRGLPLLMGGDMAASASYGAHSLDYTSFDTSQGSLFDVVHALGELMYRDATDDALVVTETLLRDHESETAGVIRAARYMADQGDLYPSAQLSQPSNFWDDLIDLVIRMSQRPGLLEAVMRSFSDPRSAQLGEIYGGLMRYKDRITFNPANVNGQPLGLPLDQGVDRTAPDNFDNESLFQRTLALIDGLNGVRVCNKEGAVLRVDIGITIRYPLIGGAGECDLINIPNVAEAYSLAILGNYELPLQSGFLNFLIDVADFLGIDIDQALERTSGILGLTRFPTPQSLNRLVFWGLADSSGVRSCTGSNCNSAFAGDVFSPVRDRHGNLVIERYHGTIFAWEMPGFYTGMTPLLQVLHASPTYQYDATGRYMFGALLGTLHSHWGSHQNTETCGPHADSLQRCVSGQPNFSYQSNAQSYEPLLADGFIEGELLARMHELNLALEAITVPRTGDDGVTALAAAGEDMVNPALNPGLTNRQGEVNTLVNDGSRAVPITPLYLLLDALKAMDRDLAVDPARRTEWQAARHGIVDHFLATQTLGDSYRLENQRARAILLTTLPFARDRVADHRTAGDLYEWSTTLHSRMADSMREPMMSALIRFLDAANEDPAARDALAALMRYLMNEESENDAFVSMVYAAADALMIMEDDRNIVPLMHALSEAMAPNARDVIASGGALDIESAFMRDALDLVRDIQGVDDERTLPLILQNAVAIPSEGEEITPLEVIIDVIAEINRATPNEGGSLMAPDFRAVIGQVTGFIRDEDHGLERLNAVVQERECFPEQGEPCTSAGSTMASAGMCYEGAMCTCVSGAWACSQ